MATVKEKMQGSITKLKEFYSGDKKKKRIGVTAGALILIIAISVFTAATLNKKEYVTLFSEISDDDISSVVSKIEELGFTEYKIKGDSVLVLDKDEDNIRAKLAVDGYPKSGFGYETYSEQLSMLTSESARQTALVQDLQDRIGATIKCFEGVKDARVNIQTGSDNRYVLDSENAVPASASVFVTMKNDEEIPEKYVEAIRNLVSTSVSGLDFENISVTDSQGNSFKAGGENSETENPQTSSDLKLRLEQQVSNRIRNEVTEALAPVYGYDNVKVSVNSTVDVSHKVEENISYTSPEGANPGEGIIGKYEYDQTITRPDNGQGTAQGAGAQPNTDLDTYMSTQGAVQGNEQQLTNSGTKDFKVNQNTQQSEQNYGVVTDVMIAVTINEDVAGNVAADQLVSHVARAAGIQPEQQAEKVNVLIAPFLNSTVKNNGEGQQGDNQGANGKFKLPGWAIYVIGGLVGLMLVLIILLIIIRKRRKKARLIAEQEAKEREEAERKALEAEIFQKAALSEAERIAAEEAAKRDILDIQNERNLELKQDIRKFTEENPEIVASMLRTWLKGDDEANG